MGGFPRSRLARDVSASRFGVGAVQFGTDYGFSRALSQADVDAVLSAALRLGVDWVDTAREYGDSEEKIGRFLRGHPEAKLTVCTKLRKLTAEEASDRGRTRSAVDRSVRESLEALGLSRIPVLLLHQPEAMALDNDALWDSIKELRRDGTVGSFGVSVYEPREIERALETRRPADLFQFPYSVLDRRFEAVAAGMKGRGIGRVGRSVFLKGVLAAGRRRIPDWLSGVLDHKKEVEAQAVRMRISAAELALRYALGSEALDAVVLGVTSVRELEENALAAGAGPLPEAAADALRGLPPLAPELSDPRRWKENAF